MLMQSLKDAYLRIDLKNLEAMSRAIQDAILQWESRVPLEPYLRIRINDAYQRLNMTQDAISEKLNQSPVELH